MSAAILPIEVAVPDALLGMFDAVGDLLRGYVARLASDLELPLEPQLGPAGRALNHDVLELTLGGRTIVVAIVDADDPVQLINDTIAAVFAARALMVTREVARAIAEAWSVEATPSFVELLRDAVRCCVRVGRLRDAVVASDSLDADSTARMLEMQLSSTNQCVDIEVGAEQRAVLGTSDELNEMFAMMKDGLFWELGLVYQVGAITSNPHLDERAFRFRLRDVWSPPTRGLSTGEYLANDTAERLTMLEVSARPGVNPATGAAFAIIAEGSRAMCESAGLTTWDARGYLVLSLSAELRRNAAAFVTQELVELYLLRLAQTFPALVAEANHRFSLMVLTRILRSLVGEELSIRDLRSVLEALFTVRGTTSANFLEHIVFMPSSQILYPSPTRREATQLEPDEYADCVRMALSRYIAHKHTRGGNTLVVYLMDPQVEERLNGAELSDQHGREILTAIHEALLTTPQFGQPPVILTSFHVRRALARLLRDEPHHPAVLSYQELSPDVSIQPIARISLPSARA